MRERCIGKASELAEGQALKFILPRGERPVEGFVVRSQGQIAAYENVCQHLPVTLDYDDNRFFTRDKRYLICQTHGALYEPATGLCVRGPCEGASLKRLQVEQRGNEFWVIY